ncbi:phage tail-collar fiber domain-containing protein [Halodesulfovibrio aestuarii]|uniref:Phage tail protein n=1 Tax=Halodesulfovibrio aestuarii TaxID=126333 RepID=A0ABV4JUI4_9BACT
MATAITYAGETLIAQKQAAGEPLIVEKFILALVPNLDPNVPVDRADTTPTNIVHEYVIPGENKGFLNPNQVVYSMLLTSDIGDFSFNWVGLAAADGTIVTVTYLPEMQKFKTAGITQGNNLTRNVLLEFSGAQEATGITVDAKTWQIDFTTRFRGIDERERLSNRDIYGRSCFFNDGFSVVKEGSNYVLKSGVGYVEGIRCVLKVDTPLTASVLPKNVFLDVSLQPQDSDVVSTVVPVLAQDKADFEDATLVKHYLVQVAEISSAGVVADVRRTEAVSNDVVAYLKQLATKAYDQASEALSAVGNHSHDDVYYTQGQVDALLAVKHIVPVGHIYPVPFLPDELPQHHYVPNGEGLLKTSGAGKTLLAMSAAYKTAHCVTENATHVFLPNVFDENGDGFFPRFVDGVNRNVGSTQRDAIQNITGQFDKILCNDFVSASGAFHISSQVATSAELSGDGERCTFDFDASRVVPTAHENRPKSYGFTPAIYLPPLES